MFSATCGLRRQLFCACGFIILTDCGITAVAAVSSLNARHPAQAIGERPVPATPQDFTVPIGPASAAIGHDRDRAGQPDRPTALFKI